MSDADDDRVLLARLRQAPIKRGEVIRLVVRIILIAFMFMFVFPLVPGIRFRGSVTSGALFAVPFALLGWIGHAIGRPVTSLSTGWLRWPIVVAVWLLGFWLVPALLLKLLAVAFPTILGVTGRVPTVGTGLLLMLVHALTLITRTAAKSESRHST